MGEIVWSGKQITKSYKIGGFQLNNINIAIREGEITGVVGENGNGKTTLLRIIAGELNTDKGELAAFGKAIIPQEWSEFKEQINYIPQRIPRWYGLLRTNLEFRASTHGIPPDQVADRIQTLLRELGLEKYADLRWSEISTGYRLRFELAKVLIGNPKLIVLDEPIANLDINAQEKFLTDLRRIVSNEQFRTAVILSSQQLHQVEAYSDNIVFIKNGIIEYSGKVDDVGVNRQTNTFELSGSFDRGGLTLILGSRGVILHEKGKSFQVETDLNFTGNELLESLIQQKIAISYFRDISSSTKKLFNS